MDSRLFLLRFPGSIEAGFRSDEDREFRAGSVGVFDALLSWLAECVALLAHIPLDGASIIGVRKYGFCSRYCNKVVINCWIWLLILE